MCFCFYLSPYTHNVYAYTGSNVDSDACATVRKSAYINLEQLDEKNGQESSARWFPTKFVVFLFPGGHEEREKRRGYEPSRQSVHLQHQQQQMAHDVRFHPAPSTLRSELVSSPRLTAPIESSFLSPGASSLPPSSPLPDTPKVTDTSKFQAGSMVELHSLIAAPEHNGRNGKLVEYSASQGRWSVEMPDGSVLALRAGNLRLLNDWIQCPDIHAHTPLRSQPPVSGSSSLSSGKALPMGPVLVVGEEIMPPPRQRYSANATTESGFFDDLPAPYSNSSSTHPYHPSVGEVRKRVADFEALSTPLPAQLPYVTPIASTPRSNATSSLGAHATLKVAFVVIRGGVNTLRWSMWMLRVRERCVRLATNILLTCCLAHFILCEQNNPLYSPYVPSSTLDPSEQGDGKGSMQHQADPVSPLWRGGATNNQASNTNGRPQRLPGVGSRLSSSAGETWVASGGGLTEDQMRRAMSTARSSSSPSSPAFKDLTLPPRPLLSPLAERGARAAPARKMQNLADGADGSAQKSLPFDPGVPTDYDEDDYVEL